ncbi:MAG: hypothetical protein JRG81_11255 [Deltaproteobacteria bacterium]|nr:hypothetical protein [Deltaproteobacteria bacterium]
MKNNIPENVMPVGEFSKLKSIPVEKVINMIRDGFYVGRKVGDDWYIDRTEIQGGKQSISISKVSVINSDIKQVVITDIKMPFTSMVTFMVKWVIASIPALIILSVIFAVGSMMFAGLFSTPY